MTADSDQGPRIGHLQSESAVTFGRKGRSRSNGISGQLRPEYAEKFVFRMDDNFASDLLGKEFKGIERFYSPESIQEAVHAGELIAAKRPDGSFSVAPVELAKAKGALRDRVLAIQDSNDPRLKPLISILVAVEMRLINSKQFSLALD